MQNVGLTLLVLWIALSNLAIGFVLAVAMGHGPRRLPRIALADLSRWNPLRISIRLPKLRRQQVDAAPSVAVESPAALIETAPVPTRVEIPVPEPQPDGETASLTDIDGLSLDEALAQFQQELAGVRGELTDIDERVRACSQAPTIEKVEECVADLKGASHRLLDQHAESMDAIASAADGPSNMQSRDVLQEVAAAQASQIRESLHELDNLDLSPENLDANCQRLLAESSAMVISCQAIDQCLTEVQVMARDGATPDGHLEQKDASSAIKDWWDDNPQHQHQVTMAMLDVDGTQQLNDALGREVVDELLHRVEERILTFELDGGSASQVNPQRFLLLLPNRSSDRCTQIVESIRVAIDQDIAAPGNSDFPVTISCAVALARSGDTARSLVSRAEATLAEAKQFGGNRTFLNEGEMPTPIVGLASTELAAIS